MLVAGGRDDILGVCEGRAVYFYEEELGVLAVGCCFEFVEAGCCLVTRTGYHNGVWSSKVGTRQGVANACRGVSLPC